jgi:hypothetical protein
MTNLDRILWSISGTSKFGFANSIWLTHMVLNALVQSSVGFDQLNQRLLRVCCRTRAMVAPLLNWPYMMASWWVCFQQKKLSRQAISGSTKNAKRSRHVMILVSVSFTSSFYSSTYWSSRISYLTDIVYSTGLPVLTRWHSCKCSPTHVCWSWTASSTRSTSLFSMDRWPL